MLLVALTITMLTPLLVCPGNVPATSEDETAALLLFTLHAVMPAVVLRTHASSTGPSLGRNMTSLGP